jgi:hypothetical protein
MKIHLNIHFLQLVILIIIFCAITSCKEENKSKYNVSIDLDITEGDHLADFVIEKIIPLETKEESIIGTIDVIKELQGKYYIQDRMKANALFAFDSTGGYINRTRVGKGPGEITVRIECFSIETKKGNDFISIFDQSGYFKIFNTNLEFNGSTTNGVLLYNTAYMNLGDTAVLVFSRSPNPKKISDENNKTYYSYHLYNSCFSEIKGSLLPLSKGFGGWAIYTPFSIYSNRILLTRPADYQIYELVGYETVPLLKVDIGKYKTTKADIEMNEKNENYFWNLFIKGERASMFSLIDETDKYIAFSFVLKSRILKYFFSKENGKIYGDEHFHFPFSHKVLLAGKTGDNKFIGIVKATDLKEYYNNVLHSNKFDYLDESHNDCLMLFTIKERDK